MPRFRVGACGRWALVCSTLALPGLAQEPEPPVYGESVEVRTGFVRFFLPADAPPPAVESLEVFWKKEPQKVLRVVGGLADPVELAIAVDRSASFHGSFAALRAATLALVDQSLDADDRLFAVGFADQWQLLAEGRGEAERVLAALPAEPLGGTRGTALFEALTWTLDRFGNADPRAALVVVSDGCDTANGFEDPLSVARRARERAIPIFLLMPERATCRYSSCTRDAEGSWICTVDEGSPSIQRGPSTTFNNPAGRTRVTLARSTAASASTRERDRFAAQIEADGGGAYVVGDPEEWPRALGRIFEQLGRQWTVVFEPSSAEVRSDEVRVYVRADGRRRRLR